MTEYGFDEYDGDKYQVDSEFDILGTRQTGSWDTVVKYKTYKFSAEMDFDGAGFGVFGAENHFIVQMDNDCTDYTVPRDPVYVYPTVASLTEPALVGDIGSTSTDHEWHIELKNYKLTQMRVWMDSTHISGFEVKF